MIVPQPATPTVGREEEVRLLADALLASQLITVVGPGGVGKTRLAEDVAHRVGDQFRGGVHTAWLGDVRDPALLLPEVSNAVGQPRSGGTGVDGLITWLGDRDVLLVLDNAEHLLDAVTDLALLLVSALPTVRLLVTSREPLLVAGETVFALRPLAVPATGARPESITASPAVQLFIDRVKARDRDFDPDDAARDQIAVVCRRLDGLPLAVELAAARAAVLGLPRLVERLFGPAAMTLSAGRDSPARHASLRAVFDWSEALLDDDERALLRRLSVFAGGFSLADLDGVIGSGPAAGNSRDVDELLAGLVEKSLVQRDRGTERCSLLETIREFAAEGLVRAGEADAYGERHAAWFLGLATEVGAGVSAGPERPWLERLGPEQDNLRVALRRTIDGPEPVHALAAAAGLPLFWWARGQHREGFTWLSDALARTAEAPAELRAAARFGLAFLLAHDTDDWNSAAVHLDEAIASLRPDEPPILGYLLCLRGEAHAYNGAHAEAISTTQRGLAILEHVPDPWGLAFAVWNVGFAFQSAGRLEEARACYTRMADIQAEHGSRLELMIAWNSLGELAERHGDFADARERYLHALEMRYDLGATRLGYVHGSLPRSLVAIARCDVALGDLASARSRLDEALPLAREMRDADTANDCVQLSGRLSPVPVVAEFRPDGAAWRVRYGAETGTIANSKGMRYLAVLLTRPHRPVAALTLTGGSERGNRVGGGVGVGVVDSDAGPLLDDAALRAYRTRLRELLAESDEADAAGDAARSLAIERERSAVLAELSRATGLGGRVRRAGSTAERARLNATRTMRDAIARIREQCPQLATHLESALHTGYRCAYEPDDPVTWRT